MLKVAILCQHIRKHTTYPARVRFVMDDKKFKQLMDAIQDSKHQLEANFSQLSHLSR